MKVERKVCGECAALYRASEGCPCGACRPVEVAEEIAGLRRRALLYQRRIAHLWGRYREARDEIEALRARIAELERLLESIGELVREGTR